MASRRKLSSLPPRRSFPYTNAGRVGEEVGQLSEAKAALVVATGDGEKVLHAFIADNAEKLGDAAKQADELDKQLVKARKRRQSMTIESPIDGVVTASAITTIGQVVNPGSELMRIVPADTALEIEAFLPNSDIGFVAAGQEAVIKVEAFPFTRYGVIHGSCHLGRDRRCSGVGSIPFKAASLVLAA